MSSSSRNSGKFLVEFSHAIGGSQIGCRYRYRYPIWIPPRGTQLGWPKCYKMQRNAQYNCCCNIIILKRDTELSSGHFLGSFRMTVRTDGALEWGTGEVNCLTKAVVISSLRVRDWFMIHVWILVYMLYGCFSSEEEKIIPACSVGYL